MGPCLFHLVITNFGKFINSPISLNKSSPIIYRFTVMLSSYIVVQHEVNDPILFEAFTHYQWAPLFKGTCAYIPYIINACIS